MRTVLALFMATTLCGSAVAAAADGPAPASNPQPLVSVEGAVVDPSGKPAANARIGIFRNLNPDNAPCPRSVVPAGCLDYLFSIGAARAHAIAGADGRFTLQLPGPLAPDADALWAEGVDSSGLRIRSVLPGESFNRPGGWANVILRQVADFVAVIRHEGQPVAGAQVQFPRNVLQRTDETGSATSHREIMPGSNVLESVFMTVRAAGFATEYWDNFLGPRSPTQTMDLARESVLTGRILDPGGRPVSRAALTAVALPRPQWFPVGLDPAAGTARTDAAGRFTLHGLGAGRRYRLIIDSDEPSVASGERIITVGGDPLDITLNAAVPVTLRLSGLRGPGSAGAVVLNPLFMEASLKAQPDLVPGFGVTTGRLHPVILMDWLDPDTGEWMPVLSPRHAKVKDATHADLRFDQVPVGTIRVHVTGSLRLIPQTLDPVTIRPGRRVVIPVPVTTLRTIQVRVVDQDGRSASGVRVELRDTDDKLIEPSGSDRDGSVSYQTDPRRELSIRVISGDQVISTTPVRRSSARARTFVVKIRL